MQSFIDQDQWLEGVFRIPGAGGCSNVYVLHGGRTLIDAGNMYGLVEELLDSGPPEHLERILLTHSHFDHVGGMKEIYLAASPDLYVHPDAREGLHDLQPPFPQFFDALQADGKLRLLRDGDLLEVEGAFPLLTLHTPGHTSGDLSFFDRRSGALFCGDLLRAGEDPCGSFPAEPDGECSGWGCDPRVCAGSLRELLRLPLRHLFPGHGEPILHRGADHVKIALLGLHRRIHEGRPQKAWMAMASDLIRAGLDHEARQCIAKAGGLPLEAEQLERSLMHMKNDLP